MKDGLASELYPDGSIYQGTFKKGQKNGMGVFNWANGEKYEGEWL